jgi:hypothetical protein
MINTGTGIAPARNRQIQLNLSGTAQPLATRTPVSARNKSHFLRGMGKLVLMSAILVLVAGGSAQAQKKVKLIGPPARQNMSVEDISTGNFLMFNPNTGEYSFTRCIDGFNISGIGTVKIDGCSISIEGEQTDHRMAASVNECAQEGKAVFEQFGATEFKVFFTDQNIGNNILACATKSQSLSIEDDVTGSFLVFDKGTGAYTFTRCSDGLTISGVGVVKVDGCMISLENTQPGHSVAASVNECGQEAKAIVEQFSPVPFKVFFSDQNMSNNLLTCAPRK